MSLLMNRLGTAGIAVSLVAVSCLTSGCTSNRVEQAAEVGPCQVRNVTSGGLVAAELQAVIDEAAPKDVLEVSGRCTGTYVIEEDLIIRGAPGTDRAVLDGDGAGPVLTITGTQASPIRVRLSHLKITGGSADEGGGIRIDTAQVRLDGTHVVNNRATHGGSIYSVGSLVLSNTRVSGNRADRFGGAIFSDGLLRLTADGMSSIRNNWAVIGGGVHALGEGVVLRGRSEIARNLGGGISGGYRRIAHGVTMYGFSAVWGNGPSPRHASYGGGIGAHRVVMNDHASVHHNQGGGIGADRVVLNDHAKVTDNVGEGYGGGIAADRILMRHQSRVVRNESRHGGGGGISMSERGHLWMSGASIVARNAALSGGGVYANYSTVVLDSRASIVHNTATRGGGGVYSNQICTPQHYKLVTHGRSTISDNEPNDILTLWDPNGCG